MTKIIIDVGHNVKKDTERKLDNCLSGIRDRLLAEGIYMHSIEVK